MIKTRTWIIFFAVIILILACVSIFMLSKSVSGTIANVYQDGKCIHSVDLSTVNQPYEFTVQNEYGSNVIRVETGRICIMDADCPDHVCIDAGWLSDSAAPIICLPHRLVIRIEEQFKSTETDFDDVSR